MGVFCLCTGKCTRSDELNIWEAYSLPQVDNMRYCLTIVGEIWFVLKNNRLNGLLHNALVGKMSSICVTPCRLNPRLLSSSIRGQFFFYRYPVSLNCSCYLRFEGHPECPSRCRFKPYTSPRTKEKNDFLSDWPELKFHISPSLSLSKEF